MVSFYSLNCKDIIRYYHGKTVNLGNRRLRCVSHIRIIAPFINSIIGNYHIEGMNTFRNIVSDCFIMSQIFNSDSVCSLDEGSLINTEKRYFWMATIQGVHYLYFNAMMNIKKSSSDACDIYPKVLHYCLVQFMLVLINFNLPSIIVVHILNLFQMEFFAIS